MPQFLYYSPYCYKSVWYEGRIWSNFVLYTKRGNRGDKIRGFGCRHTLLTVLLNFTLHFWLRHVNILRVWVSYPSLFSFLSFMNLCLDFVFWNYFPVHNVTKTIVSSIKLLQGFYLTRIHYWVSIWLVYFLHTVSQMNWYIKDILFYPTYQES